MARKKDTGHPFEALEGLKKKLADEEARRKEAPSPPKRPAAPPRTSRPSPASAEDEALSFHRLVAGVTPLEPKRGRVPKTHALERSRAGEMARRTAQARSHAEREANDVHEHLRSLVEGRFEVSDDGRHVEGRRVDVTPDVVRKLRRGLFPIDARIDLHGMTADEARGALEGFLAEKRARGERCVLVVHGKGEHSPRGVGILRGELGAWLSQGRASEHVAAFATATGEDGGEGATYVLMRR